jgi:hypothetical protein
MTIEERKLLDEDDAPTEPEDWIGAAEVRPGNETNPISGPIMEFNIYRSSKDDTLFAVLDHEDKSSLPDCPDSGVWKFFKKLVETAQKRIGFSEQDARRDIKNHGYHLSQITIDARVGVA